MPPDTTPHVPLSSVPLVISPLPGTPTSSHAAEVERLRHNETLHRTEAELLRTALQRSQDDLERANRTVVELAVEVERLRRNETLHQTEATLREYPESNELRRVRDELQRVATLKDNALARAEDNARTCDALAADLRLGTALLKAANAEIERLRAVDIVDAQAELAAIDAALGREFGPTDTRSGDLLDDFECFFEHHRATEAEVKRLRALHESIVAYQVGGDTPGHFVEAVRGTRDISERGLQPPAATPADEAGKVHNLRSALVAIEGFKVAHCDFAVAVGEMRTLASRALHPDSVLFEGTEEQPLIRP